MAITSQNIEDQLAALDTHIAEHEAEAKKLALAAVSGDKDAATKLASANAEVKRASADRLVFEQALEAILAKEAEAKDGAQAAERAAALVDAKSHAGDIVKLAAKADDLIAKLRTVLADIDTSERSAHLAVRCSGVSNPGLVGSNGLTEWALSRLDLHVRGALITDKRSVEQIASSGWRFLLELENDETEAA